MHRLRLQLLQTWRPAVLVQTQYEQGDKLTKCAIKTGFSTGPANPQTAGDEQPERDYEADDDRNADHADEYNEPNDVKVELNDKTWLPRNQYRKEQNMIKRQKLSIVFNYSKIQLTEAMESILNKGLNFSILPKNIDITQVMVDFNMFKRRMLWQEYFYNEEPNPPMNKPLFKKVKHNLIYTCEEKSISLTQDFNA